MSKTATTTGQTGGLKVWPSSISPLFASIVSLFFSYIYHKCFFRLQIFFLYNFFYIKYALIFSAFFSNEWKNCCNVLFSYLSNLDEKEKSAGVVPHALVAVEVGELPRANLAAVVGASGTASAVAAAQAPVVAHRFRARSLFPHYEWPRVRPRVGSKRQYYTCMFISSTWDSTYYTCFVWIFS